MRTPSQRPGPGVAATATSERAKSQVPRTRCLRKRLRVPIGGAGTSTETMISARSSTVSVTLRGPRKNRSIGRANSPRSFLASAGVSAGSPCATPSSRRKNSSESRFLNR